MVGVCVLGFSKSSTEISYLGAETLDSLAMAEMTTLTAAIYRKYRTKVTKGMEAVSPGITSRFEVFYDETKARMKVSLHNLPCYVMLSCTIAQEHECWIEFERLPEITQ
jgi:hypothetical protein